MDGFTCGYTTIEILAALCMHRELKAMERARNIHIQLAQRTTPGYAGLCHRQGPSVEIHCISIRFGMGTSSYLGPYGRDALTKSCRCASQVPFETQENANASHVREPRTEHITPGSATGRSQ